MPDKNSAEDEYNRKLARFKNLEARYMEIENALRAIDPKKLTVAVDALDQMGENIQSCEYALMGEKRRGFYFTLFAAVDNELCKNAMDTNAVIDIRARFRICFSTLFSLSLLPDVGALSYINGQMTGSFKTDNIPDMDTRPIVQYPNYMQYIKYNQKNRFFIDEYIWAMQLIADSGNSNAGIGGVNEEALLSAKCAYKYNELSYAAEAFNPDMRPVYRRAQADMINYDLTVASDIYSRKVWVYIINHWNTSEYDDRSEETQKKYKSSGDCPYDYKELLKSRPYEKEATPEEFYSVPRLRAALTEPSMKGIFKPLFKKGESYYNNIIASYDTVGVWKFRETDYEKENVPDDVRNCLRDALAKFTDEYMEYKYTLFDKNGRLYPPNVLCKLPLPSYFVLMAFMTVIPSLSISSVRNMIYNDQNKSGFDWFKIYYPLMPESNDVYHLKTLKDCMDNAQEAFDRKDWQNKADWKHHEKWKVYLSFEREFHNQFIYNRVAFLKQICRTDINQKEIETLLEMIKPLKIDNMYGSSAIPKPNLIIPGR